MSRKANVLGRGLWKVSRGAALLVSCGLALAGWCAPAHDVAVLNSPTTLGQRYTKYFVDVADWLSLSCRVITEADLSDMWTVDDICKEAELLVIPCNDTIARYPAELIRSFAICRSILRRRTILTAIARRLRFSVVGGSDDEDVAAGSRDGAGRR